MVHGHPHLGNAFRLGRKIGLFDFSLLAPKEVNWGRPRSILNAFSLDYEQVLGVFTRFCCNNEESWKKFSSGRVDDIISPLTRHLPITQAVREQLVRELKAVLYYKVAQSLHEQGYFKYKKRVFKPPAVL